MKLYPRMNLPEYLARSLFSACLACPHSTKKNMSIHHKLKRIRSDDTYTHNVRYHFHFHHHHQHHPVLKKKIIYINRKCVNSTADENETIMQGAITRV